MSDHDELTMSTDQQLELLWKVVPAVTSAIWTLAAAADPDTRQRVMNDLRLTPTDRQYVETALEVDA